jgi:UDP-glucose 4-epimerase
MNVLVTGGAGFLGSHLCEAFLLRGDSVVSLDLGPGQKIRHLCGRPGFRHVRGSVLDASLVDALTAQADIVYHLAAVVGVEHYVSDPYEGLNVNLNGTQQVLQAAYRHGKKVVFSSTSEVYGRNLKVPWAEDDDRVLGSTSIDRWGYSTSKAMGEHLCHALGQRGLEYTIVRFFNVYGPRLDAPHHGRVLSVFIGQLLDGAPITVIGDGSQTRCFTYVDDAIKAVVAAGLRPEAAGGTFNIGANIETTIIELAQTLVRVSGGEGRIVFIPQESAYARGYEDIARRVPDNRLMREVLGVAAETPLEDGLKATLEWFVADKAGDAGGTATRAATPVAAQ